VNTEAESSITLWWTDSEIPTIVPVITSVQHPAALRLERLYCGVIKSGQSWSYSVPFKRLPDNLAIASVTSDSPLVVASVAKSGKSLDVSIPVAPSVAGAFNANIKVLFADRDIPVIMLPVSGRVQED